MQREERITRLTAVLKGEIYPAFDSLALSPASLSPLFPPRFNYPSVHDNLELNVEHFVVKDTLFPFKFPGEGGSEGKKTGRGGGKGESLAAKRNYYYE